MKFMRTPDSWWPRRTTFSLKRQRADTEETFTEDDGDDNDNDNESLDTVDASPYIESNIDGNNTRSKRNHKSVTFATTVFVYHHPLILGDHPAVRSGVPLTLDWSASHTEFRLLDQKSKSKSTLVPALSPYVRDFLAQQAGATKKELRAAREQVRAIQASRLQAAKQHSRWWLR